MKKVEKTIDIGGKKLTISTGLLAEQANCAVLASYGETVVLATVVASPLKEDLGYFPLMVEYQERLYAGGKIKGSRWVKREGRPSDDEILSGRLIDRSIRPLFPKEYKKEVQVIITVLSVDLENSPDMISAVATSAALTASSIPWNGPIAVVRVGLKDNKLITYPTQSEMETSEMELVVSTTDKAIIMIEAEARQLPEKKVVLAVDYAQKEARKLIKFITDFAEEVGNKKETLEKKKINLTLEKKIKEALGKNLLGMVEKLAKREIGYSEFSEFRQAVLASFTEEEKEDVASLFEEIVTSEIRKMILSGKRPDGRKSGELRKLSAKVEILPRTHGSGLFERGQTQVLSIATLGAPSLEQLIESAEGEETKRYIHHYSMPPFSTGETGRVGFPSRREIGHGALAEKALLPVIPPKDQFPYTILVVSEVLSSNGSTSMASTCGSTLALMDAGVPIIAPVAGIAMGLVVENEKKYVVLTDITGVEDGYGDMDFKVAGSEEGITALQLDVKTAKLTLPILTEALEQARKARLEIVKTINTAIDKPRSTVSTYAPKIRVVKVPQEKIGEVIGPGGKTIKGIIAETGAQVDIEDDGTVNISGMTSEEVEAAVKKVELLTKDVVPGEIYEGEVKRIESFGAFIEILPGRDGMVHVSDMSMDFVKDPRSMVKIGDKVKVRVKEIDDLGRINLSMLLDGDKKRPIQQGTSMNRRQNKPFMGRNFDRSKKRSSGPHFPTSRFLEPKKKF